MELKNKKSNELKDLNLIYDPIDSCEKLDIQNEIPNFNEFMKKNTDELINLQNLVEEIEDSEN